MTDRELLEFAAKAAGIGFYKGDYANGLDTKTGFWNPLTDNGDALRLAVKLRMQIDILDRSIYAVAMGSVKVCELDRADIGAATRRAITRAAAEVGKAML